jgi:hypothetical protein
MDATLASNGNQKFRSSRIGDNCELPSLVPQEWGRNGPTYGSAYGADQELPVFNDVQVCYRIGRSGKHIAK